MSPTTKKSSSLGPMAFLRVGFRAASGAPGTFVSSVFGREVWVYPDGAPVHCVGCCRRVCPAEDYPLFEGAMRTEAVRCPCVTDEVCAVLALRIGRGTPRKCGCWVWTVVPPRAEHFRTRWSGDIRRERWTPSVAARSAAMPTVDDPWKSRFGPKTGRIDPSQHGRNPPIASHGCLDP